jgi:hypothetical protein
LRPPSTSAQLTDIRLCRNGAVAQAVPGGPDGLTQTKGLIHGPG